MRLDGLRCMQVLLRRRGSGVLQAPGPGLLPSPTKPGLGPPRPLREYLSTRHAFQPAALILLASTELLSLPPENSLPGSPGGLPASDSTVFPSHRLVVQPFMGARASQVLRSCLTAHRRSSRATASAFPERPAPDRGAGDGGLSRFSRMELACMPWFFDRAGFPGGSRVAPPTMLPSAYVHGVGTPELGDFAAQ